MPVKEEAKKERPLVANVTVEIAKPLNKQWDEIGPYMHAVRGMMHQCLNDAVTRVAVEDAISKTTDEDSLKWGPAAYAAIEKRIKENTEYFAERLKKHRKKKKKDIKDLPAWEREDKRLELRTSIDAFSSGIKDAVSSKAISAFKTFKKDSFLGTRSLPSFNNTSPIYIRDGDASWTIHREKKGYVVSIKLFPGRTGKVKFAIKAVGGSAHAHLKRMIDEEAIAKGTYKRGNMKLIWHETKRKWLAQLCYSWPQPPAKKISMKRIVAVRRGIRYFMVMGVTGDNPDIRPWIDKGDILAVKQQFKERIGSLQRHKRELGGAALKHGVPRREQRVTALRSKEKNWVKTKCQRAAAALIKYALAHGAGLIAIEDWSIPLPKEQLALVENDHLRGLLEKFPFYQLKECILWAAKKEGIQVVEVNMRDTYDTCPKCDYKEEAQYDKSTRVFECFNPKCKTKRPIEYAMVWHMLKRAGGKGVDKAMQKVDEDTEAEATKLVKKIKKTQNGKKKAA